MSLSESTITPLPRNNLSSTISPSSTSGSAYISPDVTGTVPQSVSTPPSSATPPYGSGGALMESAFQSGGGGTSSNTMPPHRLDSQEQQPQGSATSVSQQTTTATAADSDMSLERKVVVAIDESSASTNALKWSVKQLVYPQRDHLIILTVGAYKSSYIFGGGAEKVAKKEQKAEERSERVLANANKVMEEIQTLRNMKISFELVALKAVDNDVRDVITDYVKDTNPDLLVMGSHGAGALKRSILGSTSSYLLHHSPCPVIIVKEQGATAA